MLPPLRQYNRYCSFLGLPHQNSQTDLSRQMRVDQLSTPYSTWQEGWNWRLADLYLMSQILFLVSRLSDEFFLVLLFWYLLFQQWQTHLLYNANVYVQIKLISILIYIINNIELILRYTNMIHVFIWCLISKDESRHCVMHLCEERRI